MPAVLCCDLPTGPLHCLLSREYQTKCFSWKRVLQRHRKWKQNQGKSLSRVRRQFLAENLIFSGSTTDTLQLFLKQNAICKDNSPPVWPTCPCLMIRWADFLCFCLSPGLHAAALRYYRRRICVTKEEVSLLYGSHHSVLTPKWRCSPNHCFVPLARVQGAPSQSGWDFCYGHRKDLHKAHAFGRRDLHSAACDYMDANVKIIQGSEGAEKTNIPSKVHIEIASGYVTC